MSAGSSSNGERLRSLRPWFLVAAMILTWLAGVNGTMNGCHTVSFLRQGSVPESSAVLEQAKADETQGLMLVQRAAEHRAYADAPKRMMPLSIAQVLLSLLLVIVSAMVLAGRPGSRSLALQVIAANTLFVIVQYALTQPIREAWINAVAYDTRQLPFNESGLQLPFFDVRTPAFWWLCTRLGLALHLGVLGAAGAALASPRTRAFMDAVARAEERLEREDEP
ncbi:MAG: hypothetical protein HOW73_03765 [Polyangiaceae bacterium]|nr:hypothetical protein [Polyangiaceae bacterium]